jgi:hypothetical protein
VDFDVAVLAEVLNAVLKAVANVVVVDNDVPVKKLVA